MRKTIVVVDVASFTDPARTMLHQGVVLEGLRKVLRGAFSETGIELDTCEVEDRGDGKLILMPLGVDNTKLADLLPSRLVAWLRRHNAVYRPEAQVKLRVALHEGEVREDDQGVLSAAVNLAFDLVDAPEAKSILRSTPSVLALIASDHFYQDVIFHDPAADPRSYRQISVQTHEASIVAWLCMPEGTPHQVDYSRVLGLFPPEELQRLREWLTTITLPNLRTLVHRAANLRMPPSGRLADAWEAFSYLEEFNASADGFPPALMFVELVAHQEAARDVSADLMRWNDEQARRLRLESQLKARRATISLIPVSSLLHLLIVVEPDGIDPDLYQVSHWRQDDATVWPPARGETHMVIFDDLERCVDDLVVNAENAWSGHTGSVALEFVLPRALLNLPVQHWRKEYNSGDPRPLCLDYSIVVRSLERMRSLHWHRAWHQRWQILMDDPSTARVHFAQLADTGHPYRIDAILSDLRCVLMVLTEAPSRQPRPGADELNAALRSGLPALLWHPEVSSEVLQEIVTRLMESGGLGDLPGWARVSRQAALQETTPSSDVNLIRDLVVLWDNPDRLVILDQPLPGEDTADERGRAS